ncbi:hypothetical protein [Halopenitus persicus]|uniref:hypothetical protein n=1 Tax=Halopenitus persicus TaxID=1048396 RepID=UPI000BBA5E52|nr:hypothetical protein [Halopenitus persicus]
MNDNENDFENEHSIRAIWTDGEGRVEDHRIRPQEVSEDKLEMSLLMRLGGPRGRFYLHAEVTFADDEDEGGHHIEIRRRAGDVVDEFTIGWTTADPDDATGATQAIYETYLHAADDWYAFAVGAEQAEDETEGEPICTTFTPATDAGDFGYICPSCEKTNPLKGDPLEFADVPFDCTGCGHVAFLDGEALTAFAAELAEMEDGTPAEMQAACRIHEALHDDVEADTAVEQSVQDVEDEVDVPADMLVTTRAHEDIWMLSWGEMDVEVTVAEDGALWQIEVTERGEVVAKATHNDEEFPTAEEAGGQNE